MKLYVSKMIILILCVILSSYSGSSNWSNINSFDNSLKYQIQYIDKSSIINITAMFRGGQSERTLIHVPSEGILNLTATADGKPARIIKDPANPNKDKYYILHPRPGSLISVSYTLTQVSPNPPTPSSLFHALINNTYFYFVGYQALIWPDQLKKDVQLSLTWSIPSYTKLFNSFGILQEQQIINLDNINSLMSGLFIGGGDFRLANINKESNGQIIYTVMCGKWPFTDTEYAVKLDQVFAGVNKFWPTGHPKTLLNVILPVNPLQKNSNQTVMSVTNSSKFQIGGVALYNAFISMATTPDPSDPTIWSKLSALTAHEYNHHWIPGKLVMLNPNDLGGRWFTEGINEYMSAMLRLRTNNMTLGEYVERSNRVIAAYFTSPAFGEYIDFGQYPPLNIETMFSIAQPYYRGELLAWRWTATNRKQKPVEVALLNMLRDAQTSRFNFSDDLVAKYLTQAGVRDVLKDIRQYARNGNAIVLTGKELGPCVAAKEIPMLRYDIGFDLQRSKQYGKILGLKPDGPAMRAGLKEGDLFTKLTYKYGNTSSQVEVALKTSQQVITYSPTVPIRVLQYYLIALPVISGSMCNSW